MNSKQKYLILKTVQENNILPITSKCNLQCKFCSHFQNPPQLKVESYGHLDLDFIKKMIDFLPQSGGVILGESATKIIEGEPFFHPDIKEILKFLRNKWPDKEIKITTNGSFLRRKLIKFMSKLGNITLNISLNCSNPFERKSLMNDSHGEKTFNSIKFLADYDIKYNGSIVALPHLMGWASIEKTIDFLDHYGAETIRVFMPAFTDYSKENNKFEMDLYSKLSSFVNKLNQKVRTPVIFEPPYLKNLDAVIKGIIADTPAAKTKLKKGAIIKKVNGEKVVSRVDAFEKIKKSRNPILEINNNSKFEIIINKKRDERSGIIMDYDLAPFIIEKLINIIRKSTARHIILVTSKMAKKMFDFLVRNKISDIFPEYKIKVLEIENNFFGGSIVTAGLLTINDIEKELQKYKIANLKNSLVIMPSIMFDNYKKDLIGQSSENISEKFGVKTVII